MAQRREGEGESGERALLGAFSVMADRSQEVSKPGRLKYWLFGLLVGFAIAAAIGAYTQVPGLEDGHWAPVAVPPEPNAPANVSDLAARLQALQTAPSPDASGLPVAASPATRAPSPDLRTNAAPVVAVNPDAPPLAQTTAPNNAVRGVSDKEILFGMAAPFSGASRELGRQMKMGVETAFDEINSASGVNGRQLRLVAADDGYEPVRTAGAMRVLYDKDQVFGFIGNVGTPTAVVALPFALDHRALFFGAFSGANLLRRDPPDRYVFNYRASYAEETKAVVRYLVRVRRIQPSEIVVFAQQDAYGDSGYNGVQKAVRSLPGDYPDIVRLNYKRNTVDVQDAVYALRAFKGKIKAVVMVASYRAAAKFIEKTRDLYPSLIYTNVSFVGSTALADELMLLGPRYAAGMVVTQVVPAINSYASIVLSYKQALAKYFPGESPDYVSFEGYIDARILAEAVKRVGRDINTEKLVNQLEQMHVFDLGLGAPVTFSANEHQGSHKVWGTQLDDTGHYQPIDLE
jgi:ABC-type branched-subunit amino acid transport system substrate-binding protein